MHTEWNLKYWKGECNIFGNCPALSSFSPIVNHRPLSPVLGGHSAILKGGTLGAFLKKTQRCVYFVHTQFLPIEA